MHHSDIELERFADFQPTGFDRKGLGSDWQADWLVCPLIFQPKIAGLLETSNWETAVTTFEQLQRRYSKARRRILHKLDRRNVETPFLGVPVDRFAEEMCRETAYTHECVNRLLAAVGLELVEGETIAGFAERLESQEAAFDYETHYFGHWATDFKIIVVRPNSWAHREAQSIAASLSDYPVLDESDYSRREYEQQHADIADGLSSLTVYDAAGDELDTDNPLTVEGEDEMDPATRDTYLVHQIWEHMWNDGQPWRCLKETGREGGGGVDRDDVERALEEMGYQRIEDGYGEWIAIGLMNV